MAMAHFDVSLAYDQIVKRGVPGQVARVSDAETDLPYTDLLDLDGNPLVALVSNSQGYVPPFQIQDGPALVKMSVGGVTYYLQDLNLFGETAQAAQQAAADAQKAAGLVEAPADEVVATLVQGGTLTQTAGDARWVTIEGVDVPVTGLLNSPDTHASKAARNIALEAMDRPVDPSAFLDNIEVVCKFSMYRNDGEGDERVYVQGMSINEADDELYLNYGGGPKGWQRFEVRRLSTGELLSERKIASGNAYGQGMPWWKNTSGDLCFIAYLTEQGFYSVYNYTQNTAGAAVPILASSHGDRYGDFYVTINASGGSSETEFTEFYIYDWESMKAEAPVLVRTVKISNPGTTPAKLQGETMIGGHFFTHGGNPSTNGGLPTICHYDSTGQLLKVHQFDVMDLVRAINANRPGLLVERPTLNWEAEGITHSGGKLYTQHVFGHVDTETHDQFGGYIRSVVILRHNSPTGTLVPSRPATDYVRDTGWADATYLTGYTYASASRPLQYRVKDGMVYWRGSVKPTAGGDLPVNTYLPIAATPPVSATPTQVMRFASGDILSSGFVMFERGQAVKIYLRTAQGQISMDVPPFPND